MLSSHPLVASLALAASLLRAGSANDDLRPRAQVSGRFVAAPPQSKGRFLRVLPFCKPDNSDFRFPKTLAFAPKSKGVSHWGCARNRGSIKRLGLGRRRARLA